MDQPFTAVNRNPSQLFFRLCVALRSEICKGYARFIFAYYQCIRRWFVSHIPFVVRKKKAVLHNGAGGVGRGFMREGEIFSIIMVSGTITLQRHAMNNARTVLLGFFLFVGALNSAMADSCRANIQQQIEYFRRAGHHIQRRQNLKQPRKYLRRPGH